MIDFAVVIAPDGQTIRDRVASCRPITSAVHVRVGNLPFPDPEWDDFAVVILAQWLEQINSLYASELNLIVLRFMDGPYEIRISQVDGDQLLLVGVFRGLDVREVFREECLAKQVVREIQDSSRELIAAIRKAGVWDTDCAKLVRALNDAIPTDL